VNALVTTVIVRKNEPLEKALRRFKKKIDKEGTMKALRDRQYYEKPSQKKRRKQSKSRS